MTEKLFYADAHLRKFTARVLSCEESGRLFAVTLDRTAFFPEGGGQSGDIGTLGGARVTDTREERGEILHFCDAPLVPGAEVTGELDWETRFARMQIHSAEHLVSGHAHALWGCGNVGFHMDEHGATIDFDRELDAPQLMRLERLVNEDVWKNLPINILWPAEEELAAMPFRQKKELSMPVRIVEVPGVDLCACCAPHVSFTGEIGLVRLKDRMRHRGGVRFTMLAGRAAYEDAALCAAETESLSRLFSAPQNALCAAAERVLGELEEEKYARAAAERRYVEARLAAGKPCVFESHLPGEKLQQLIVVSGSVFQGGIATVHGNHASDYVLVERNVLNHRFLKHRHNQDYRYRRQNILEDDSSFSVKFLSHCQNELVLSLPELTLLPLPNPPSPDPELPELKPPRPVPEPPEDEPPPPAEPTLLFFPGWR